MAGFVDDAHSALTKSAFEMILPFEHRFARDRMDRRHPIVRTGRDVIGVAIFTELTLFHLLLEIRARKALSLAPLNFRVFAFSGQGLTLHYGGLGISPGAS